jgi:hypothetical protein
VLPRPILRYAEDKAGAFASRTEAANIGTEALAHFVLDIDYGRNVIWFEHQPGYQQPAFSRIGLRAIKTQPKSFKVTVVAAGAPAALAGITADDEITAVDGVPAEDLSGRDLNRKMTQAAGTELRLSLLRGGVAREQLLKLVELLP